MSRGAMMTRKTFDMIDVVEVLVDWHAGRKSAEAGRSLGGDRGTDSRYAVRAEAEAQVPGSPPRSKEQLAL